MFIQTASAARTANLVLDKSENRSRFFRLNSHGFMENSLHQNVYDVVNSLSFCSKEARASIGMYIE